MASTDKSNVGIGIVTDLLSSSTLAPPTTTSTDPPIRSLPLHLIAHVLAELGRIQDLPAALLSNSIFFDALGDFPGLTRDVLRAQIPDDEVFVLALLAHESHPARRTRTSTDARTFLEAYRDDPYSLVGGDRYLRLTEALRIGELHSAVGDLRDEFLRRTLSRLYSTAPEGDVVAQKMEELSAEEVRRVERGLYRFEIYCNLFGGKFRKGSDDVETKRIFYDLYSSWANEQLGCVYDCLEAQLGEALDQVISQEGDDATFLFEGGKQRRKQQYFSLGLPFLHQLTAAPTASSKLEVLRAATGLLSADAPPPASSVSNESKYRAPGSPSEWTIDVRELARETDADPGPRATWEAAHAGGSRDVFFFADHEVFLRRLGYVMWDRRRGEEPVCRASIESARANATPAFVSAGRLMNVARSWDKPFQAPVVAQRSGERARRRRAK